MYTLYKSRTYQKAERKYGKVVGTTALLKMEATLRESPKAGPRVQKLRGETDLYRYRLGDYRVIYAVGEQEVLVMLMDLGPRGGVCKK